jgi:mxaK protein
MGMSSHRRLRVVFALLAATIAAIAIDGVQLWRTQRWNALIAAGRVASTNESAPAELQFALAGAHAASGADDAALQRYRALHDDPALGLAARYNSANLLMRQALAVRGGTEPGKAIALIELAKELYRDVLRADAQHWDARYNLERAQRLLPDPDAQEAAPPEARNNAERAATTMRGYSPGLP